jgi:hypothetical protein
VTAVVRVAGVQSFPATDGVVAHVIDHPAAGSTSDAYTLLVAGWVIGTPAPVAVEVVDGGKVVRRAPVQLVRPGVAARFPELGSRPSGYSTPLGLVGLAANASLELRAVLAGDRRVPLGRFSLERTPLVAGERARFRPLMVTSLGRMGTTWLMRLLAEHPAIVARRSYPYELMVGRYWAHQLRVLSGPADYGCADTPDTFAENLFRVGPNPFYGPLLHDAPELEGWFGRQHVERMAGFCVETIDAFYEELARLQGQRSEGYFAEKFLPDHLPALMWELYPGAREVVLVRDVRDVVCSMLAFNAKRGNQAFGRDHAGDDREFVHNLAGDLLRLRRSWEERADRIELVRYEDLVVDPAPVLRRVLAYAGLDHDDQVVAGMVERAGEEIAGLSEHRTSAGPRQSIGRWRRDLAPELAAACNEEMLETLAAFGYESEAA